MSRALVLTYHSIAEGPAPLCIEPGLFARHVEVIAASGATAMTVSGLAEALRAGTLPDRVVAITFDDGFADTAEVAAPLLRAHGLPATVFCVSGFVGGANDWPSQPPAAPRRPLASAAALESLVGDGWEIGAHGVDHAPLDELDGADLRMQLERSRDDLERLLAVPVQAFAFPYGRLPPDAAAVLAATGYAAGCTTTVATVRSDTDPRLLPRVDAHYLRRPRLLGACLGSGGSPYLASRRAGAALRRAVR